MVIARAVALVALAVTLLGAPLAVGAQQPEKMPLVGILDNGVPRLFTAFREGLRELGYVEDQNIRLAVKSAHGRPDLIPGLAADLVALKPDVMEDRQGARADDPTGSVVAGGSGH